MVWCLAFKFVTGFVKRGLLHTSNSINSEDHNLVFKRRIKQN